MTGSAQPDRPVWPKRFEEVLSLHLPATAEADQGWEPDVPLRDMGIESLAIVGLMMDLEVQFDFLFPDECVTIETFHSAASLWAVVSELVGPVARN
jgi:acyl carrier protein